MAEDVGKAFDAECFDAIRRAMKRLDNTLAA